MGIPRAILLSGRTDQYENEMRDRTQMRSKAIEASVTKMEQSNDWLIWATIFLSLVEALSTIDFYSQYTK